MAHLLIISTFEVAPKGGMISGPAIRCLEMARALSGMGHRITLAQPHRVPDAADVRDAFRVILWNESNLKELADDADACLVAHYVSTLIFKKILDRPVIVDLFDPEFMALVDSGTLFQDSGEHFGRLNEIRLNLEAALAHGDLFLCANSRQRDFYLGMLTLAGRVTPEFPSEKLMGIVPTGVPVDSPKPKEGFRLFRGGAIPEDWKIVLCPGGLYPWFDPELPIKALHIALQTCPDTVMIFVGADNPISPEFSESGASKAKRLAAELNLLNRHVFFHPWIPYEDRGLMYLESDLAVVCSLSASENPYSFRTRIIDCLWGGKPIICTSGDTLSRRIEEVGAGRSVAPHDPVELAAAMTHFLRHDAERERAAQSASWLAQNEFTWTKSVKPIHEFLTGLVRSGNPGIAKPSSTERPVLLFDMKRQRRLLNQKSYLKVKSRSVERKMSRLYKRLNLASATVRKVSVGSGCLRERAERAESELSFIRSGRGWRMLLGYYRIRDRVLGSWKWFRIGLRHLTAYGPGPTVARVIQGNPFPLPGPDMLAQYRGVLKKRPPWNTRRKALMEEMAGWEHRPLVSIATPVYNTDPEMLRRTIESVQNQVYPHWEWCLVDDGSSFPQVGRILREAAERDPRFRCETFKENRGIVAASNACLRMCTGDFVGFLDHDDLLEPDALWEVVRLINRRPDADIIYTDEDKIDEHGKAVELFFRPDWSPDLLLSTMYMVHFNVFRKSLLQDVEGFRPGFTISQDYDLLLRATEKTDRIFHIPKVLYHWRNHKNSRSHDERAMEDTNRFSMQALNDAVQRRNTPGRVEPGAFFNFYRVRYRIQGRPLISVIIPTRDRLQLLHQCLVSLREKTRYSNYEIIVIDNQSALETRAYLKHCDIRLLRAPYEFNFSRIMNEGSRKASGEYLLFMNNDMEITEPEWMEALLEHAQRKAVGAVGAKLIYPGATIQHAGVVLGLSHNRVAGHIFQGFPSGTSGYMGYINTIRNVSAVTAACMMTRKELFLEMGGFEPKLGVAFQDVDYCLRLREAGYRVVYTPYACLVHFESASRGHKIDRHEEVQYMLERWGHLIAHDPFYNPNLTLSRPDASLRV